MMNLVVLTCLVHITHVLTHFLLGAIETELGTNDLKMSVLVAHL